MTTNEILNELIQMEREQDFDAEHYRQMATEYRKRDQTQYASQDDRISASSTRRAEALEAAIAIIKNEN